MAGLRFTKAVGCGNDFLIVERNDVPNGVDIGRLTVQMCDRHNGVGADGIEWVSEAGGQLSADLINCDGSVAELSGNGTRCVAAWYAANGKMTGNVVRIQTGAGVKECHLLTRAEDRFEFEMAIGRPQKVDERAVAGQSGVMVDYGNPHFVLFVGSFNFDWQAQAARLQADTGAFPRGTNVEFVRILNQHTIEARFYERGAGETLSSGTGSCAAAMASVFSRFCSSPVTVSAPGGAQVVRIEDQTYLRGPARLICTGTFSILG
jgi:diaminopimelate epimerase